MRNAISLTVVLGLAACQGLGATPSMPPSASPSLVESEPPGDTPPGRILAFRMGSDGVHEYFTVNTDGTDEQALGPIGDCAPCVRWSLDGTRVWTMGSTGHGTWSFMSTLPDGSDAVVIDPPIDNLSLGPATPSVNGRWLAFDGWDETDPSRNGVYLGSEGLADLHLVTPLPEGTVRTDPFGVTPDGSHVLFFVDRGETEHAQGDLYIVKSDGSDLRKINPPGTTHKFIDVPSGGLSPDGRQAAFGVDGRIFVVDVDDGEAKPITDTADFVWAVSWSPTGEWITYTRHYGSTAVISLVRPDGSDQKDISANDADTDAEAGVWSPDGAYLLVRLGLDGAKDLWIMNLEGTLLGQVTHEPSSYSSYGWAPAAGS